jgi:hypothetical protein
MQLLKSQSALRAKKKKIKIYQTLIRAVTPYRTESWTLNKDIAEWLAAFERKVLRRMFEGINGNENWRKRYNKELVQLFGDLGILSFVRISRLNWIGLVNRMESKRKLSVVYLTIILMEVNKKKKKKTGGGIVYKQILVNAK